MGIEAKPLDFSESDGDFNASILSAGHLNVATLSAQATGSPVPITERFLSLLFGSGAGFVLLPVVSKAEDAIRTHQQALPPPVSPQ